MITIEVNGVPFENFTSATVTYAIDTLTRSFQFASTNVPANQVITFPFQRGDACRVLVDGEAVVTGFIESIQGGGSATSHMLSVEGRGLSADLLDSQLYKPEELTAGSLTLADIIRTTLRNIALDIEVIDNVNPPPFNQAEDIVAPEMGMAAFDLIEQYARKRQALISENADGNIVIANTTPEEVNYQIIHKVENNTNNVISWAFQQSDVDLFNKYIIVGAQDAVVNALGINQLLAEFNLDPIVFQTNEETDPVVDSNIRLSRQYVVVMGTGYSNQQCAERAEWSRRVRLARARNYSATVLGYRDFDGNLFDINTLVDVDDEYANINRKQLINSITFSYSLRGSFTVFGLLEPDSYLSDREEPPPLGPNQDDFGDISDF